MGIESGAVAFLSGFASTYYGGTQSLEAKALEKIEFAKSKAAIALRKINIDADLAHRAGVNKGLKEVKIGNILEHRKLQGDETLLSDLVPFLQKQSYPQVKSFYDRVHDDKFSGFFYVDGDQDFANAEAVKSGNMEIIFKTPTGTYYGHAPSGQENKVKMAVQDLALRIHIAQKTLREESPDMTEDERARRAYELGFNSASSTNQNLFTKYNTVFTMSMADIIKEMKSIFVTPDSFSSQMRRVAVLQAQAEHKRTTRSQREANDARDVLQIQMLTRASKRGMYAPQQYAKAMRKLFSPYISMAAILGSNNQKSFMRRQLSDSKMVDRLFEILKRLYPEQNTPAKPTSLPNVDTQIIDSLRVKQRVGTNE